MKEKPAIPVLHGSLSTEDIVGLYFFLWKTLDAIEAGDTQEAKHNIAGVFQCIPKTTKTAEAFEMAIKLRRHRQAEAETAALAQLEQLRKEIEREIEL